jgi:hypothetical protein
MLKFDELISHFGPEAVAQLCSEAGVDDLGLAAMNRRDSDGRVAALRKWMDTPIESASSIAFSGCLALPRTPFPARL